MALIKFILFVVLQSLVFNIAQALQCYRCKTHNDTICKDKFLPPDISPHLERYLETCEDYKPNPYSNDKNSTLMAVCRKVIQKINDDERIIRSCGYEDSKKPANSCYKKPGSVGVSHLYCYCKGPLCNESNSLVSTPILIASGLLMVLSSLRMVN